MDSDVIAGVCIGLVALASVVDLWATLPGGDRARRARASNEGRCPYCHQDVADGTDRVSCVACVTRHHQACWEEHRRCSVFGCGSAEHVTPVTAGLTAAPIDPAG